GYCRRQRQMCIRDRMEGRAEAVTCAVMQAKENDVVLVAGKGHEDYQIVGNQRLDYSDRVTVARLLGVIA
ncbi:hypothetical protein KQJ25_09270, partial [Escherichia sp. S69_ASV_4]|nr:hypothetical protein [Escherichia sp. S69_ASV_4]